MKHCRSVLLYIVICGVALSHEETDQLNVAKSADFDDRVARTRIRQPEKMDPALRANGLYMLRKQNLASQGLSPSAIAEVLWGGREFAYPYSANPELKSRGNVKTLTLLIDFKNNRASSQYPNLSAGAIRENIYGHGTAFAQSKKPYESVNAYYRRASQDSVNIDGNVLGWYHLPMDREDYRPDVSGLPLDQKMRKENAAIFQMVKLALESFDATHDFAQYDNDNDGDIDLVTILYAGPDTGWGSFWWAYRWSFYVPEASATRFDGKRVKQFVFQFVSERDNGKDFNPKTLLHEMGHAFGLPDYYDYDSAVGPPGGVGKLDMMDANWANHNAFSRWLLDWIAPEVISLGSPREVTLRCSGARLNTNKAIAIFPNLPESNAPAQELFIVENRFPVGNDGDTAGLPGSGVLIWHVVATPNADDDGFSLDNSYTTTKLIRLVRADTTEDFDVDGTARKTTFYGPGASFTPLSVPSSMSYSGRHTGVSITDFSTPGESMTAKIGFVPIASEGTPSYLPVTPSRSPTPSPTDPLSLEALESAAVQAATSTPEELRKAWQSFSAEGDLDKLTRQNRLILEVQLRQWAAKDGQAAIAAVASSGDQAFSSRVLPSMLDVWAASDAPAAFTWHESGAATVVLTKHKIQPSRQFFAHVYAWRAKLEFNSALQDALKISDANELVGAIQGVESAASALGVDRQSVYLAGAASLRPQLKKALESMLMDRAAKSLRTNLKVSYDAIRSYDALQTKKTQ